MSENYPTNPEGEEMVFVGAEFVGHAEGEEVEVNFTLGRDYVVVIRPSLLNDEPVLRTEMSRIEPTQVVTMLRSLADSLEAGLNPQEPVDYVVTDEGRAALDDVEVDEEEQDASQ